MTTIDRQLVGYLKDAHALQEHVEATLSELLTAVAEEPDVCRRLGRYAERTRAHTREIEARLRAHGSAPSIVRDAGRLFGAVLEAGLGRARRDPAGRHIRDAYVAAHLQIASAEMLRRVADRAGDAETARIATALCDDAHALSAELSERWDLAVELSLRQHGLRDVPPPGDSGPSGGAR
jgi:ferritin-like metal-binding protein YciE